MAATERLNSLGKCTLNPRGNLWLKDESKIGQKLLTKMGWKRGKGLGRNEDGITENIKVKFKGSNAGIGWKEKSFLGAQNEEFDAVLENLNKNYLSNGKELSKDCKVHLVQRCEKFRERFHYRRFVKEGISEYSEKDIKGIFIGMKTEVEKEELLYEKSSTSDLQNTTLENNSSDLTTTYNSNSSIADYFAQKMNKKAGNLLTSASINSKGLNSNSTWPLLSNEIQEPGEVIQESLPDHTEVKNKKRKKSSKNSKFEKHKLGKISGFKSSLKRVPCGNKMPVKMKKNVSFNNLISYQEIPLVSNENNAISDEETAEFQNLDNKIIVNDQIPTKISHVQNFNYNEENERFNFNKICSNNNCVSSENDIILNKSDQSSGDIISKKVKIERSSDNSDVVHLEVIPKQACVHVTSNTLYSDCTGSTLLNITQEQNEYMPESLSNVSLVKSNKRKKSSKNSKSKNCKLGTVSEFMNCLESVRNYNKFQEILPENAFLNNSISSQEISLGFGEGHEASMEAVTGLKDTDDKNSTVEQKFRKNSNLSDCGLSDRNKEAEFVKTNINNYCNNLENKLVLNDDSAKKSSSTKKEVEHKRTSEVRDYSGNTYSEEFKRKENSTSNYNSWLESQRIAMKMNIYKSMREKIKNHRILSTTNLLQIKGYGNWGF
ncbi:PIN2/TERF1-interacting telomerase inhibitor 1, partial [Stegodyphus mimosarum]